MTTVQIQHLLCYLGYDTGGVDGIYGPKTRQAVTDFQRERGGLAVDGDAGQATQKDLLKAVGELWQRPKPAPAAQAPDGNGPAWWQDIRYFRRSEPGIACPCGKCGGFPAEPEEALMRLADRVRAHFDREMVPTSTVRCQAKNDSLPGSAKNSRHLRGKAMDFVVSGVPASIVLPYVQSLSGVNYAYSIAGSNAVHMDIL